MTKKEFARLKTEPLNILRIKERFTLPRIVDIQHPLDQKLVLIQILIMCAVLLLSRPFVSALHGVSRAPGMCVSTVKVWDIGEKTVRSSTEPARIQLQQHILNEAPNLSADTVNDKYFIDCNFFNCYENNVTEFEIFSEQVNYFENSKLHGSFKGVKGNLKKHIQYWKDIGANEFILGTISEGYVIPFSSNPPSMCFKNNRSAFQNHDFVDTAIAELVDNGCAIKVPFKPYVVSPLSVATQKSGKKRLILDLSVLNKFVRKDKFKYEDWKVAIQLFGQNCYMYKFDLKSGYHHFDICTKQQTYLGFSWKGNFYCFTVLPFGLLSSPFLFTKCLRAMVKYWRSKAVNIVLYLDDGLGMSLDYDSCFKDSFFIRKSLTEAGFLINVDKSVFTPAQSIEWLGIIWDSVNFSLQIPDRRVQDLIESVSLILSEFPLITARNLAQVTGKIISMSPVIGNISRLMTRYCYMIIETRSAWDSLLEIIHSDQVKAELVFWQENIVKLNRKYLAGYSCSSVVIYSDASDIAAGACTVELKSKNFHKMWNSVEKVQSSTWREMKAIELALSSFKDQFQGKTIKWFTDNQNCVKIVKSGSMKLELQKLARSIYSTCVTNSISIDIQWIPRSENEKADYISRLIDHEDWEVSGKFFDLMNGLWGPFTIDRFANFNNKKLNRYNSLYWNPGSEAIDAFSQNWQFENNWLVPPVFSVLRVIKHLLFCKARGTLIVPKWISAPYWPYIFDENLCYRTYVSDVLEFKNTAGIFVPGTNPNSIFGKEPFITPVLAVKFQF